MLTFALFGAGRIGQIHAVNLVGGGQTRLKHVVDPSDAAARSLASRHGAKVSGAGEVFSDKEVGAVIIASSTDTHADLAVAAAKAGKAIFCEKPIDLSLARVDACLAAVKASGVPMQIGFNRRFDPDFRELKSRLQAGAVGSLEQVVISSRDPGLPPRAYLEVSGGQFRDMTIHDFDMARWLLGEEPEELFAYGSALVDPTLGAIGDVDSVMVLMRTRSGRLAHINNSRRASYGYDQRIEVHGSKGRLIAGNRLGSTVEQADGEAVKTEKPLHFFLERYADAYRNELGDFVKVVTAGAPVPVGPEDGRMALVLAEAAVLSLKEHRPVRIVEIAARG